MMKNTVCVSTSSSPLSSSSTTKSTTGTPPGFNKSRRDVTKLLLLLVLVSLLSNANAFATLTSATTILIMKQGTLFSTKNLKWSIISIISFLTSLTVMILLHGSEIVDEDKAYSLKISLYLWAKFLQITWSIILGLFLFSTFSSSSSSTLQTQQQEQMTHYRADILNHSKYQ